MAAQGGAAQRARAYLGSWATRRGVYQVDEGLLLIAGSPLARQLTRRLAWRVRRSAFSLAPLFTGAVAGAMINRRETRRLGHQIRDELRQRRTTITATRDPLSARDEPGRGWHGDASGPGLRYAPAPGRWVIAATVLGSGIAALDATVVGIALPAIGRDFHASVASLQWVVDGYTLTLAGLLLLGGALGDVHGRRKVFMIGTVWFALASLACGLAPNTGFLIAARALQGAGAALLTPGSLSILQASFAPDDRSKAIGAWSGLGGVATAVGPFLGGWLISAVSWRLIFFINLPVAVAVIVDRGHGTCRSRAPPARPAARRGRRGNDQPGARGPHLRPDRGLGGRLDVAAACWPACSRALPCSRRSASSRRAARHPCCRSGCSGPASSAPRTRSPSWCTGRSAARSSWSPWCCRRSAVTARSRPGLALLPLTAIMLALSARSAALAARIGPRLQMTVGPLLIAAGMLLFTRVNGSGDYLTQVLPAVLVLGLGLATNVAPLTATALSAAPAEHSGIASAVNNDVARTASLIAVAVLPALAGITGDAYLHPAALTQASTPPC